MSAESSAKPQGASWILRHEDEAVKEPSNCGHRFRLLSRGDEGLAAWAHAVDIDGAKPHYHKRSTELYYVLDGEGHVILDGEKQDVRPGTVIHIPPGVVHEAVGRMRVLVVGIPDIDDDDIYPVEDGSAGPDPEVGGAP